MITTNKPISTIDKTLITARLFDGFWERWIAHGIEREAILMLKDSLINLESWEKGFSYFASTHHEKARNLYQNNQNQPAAKHYKLAALYYNLTHWIYPNLCDEKLKWYLKSKELFLKADQISDVKTKVISMDIDGHKCVGRIRVPDKPKGCIIIINPIDSAKEELFTYEDHFVESGFATISFDGPGQGETFTVYGLKATLNRWEIFIDKVISIAHETLTNLPIYLFGTSSGAVWSIIGSANPFVKKAVAVSPAVGEEQDLPNHFKDRLNCVLEENSSMIPKLTNLRKNKNILIFHGNNDVMVEDKEIHKLYSNLPHDKRLIEYPEEGHCCNNRLFEVRELAMKWFTKEGKN